MGMPPKLCHTRALLAWFTPFLLLPLLPVFANGQGKLSPEELVTRLGSSSYAVRESAFQQLLVLKTAAIPALQAGWNGGAPEVKVRCQSLLVLAEQSELNLQLKEFVETGDPGSLQPLPYWSKFRTRLGDGYQVRFLYASVYKSDPDLFPTLAKKPALPVDSLYARCAQLLTADSEGNADAPPRPLYGQIGAVLYLAALPEAGLEINVFRQVYHVLNRPEVKPVVAGNALLKELLSTFLMRQSADFQTLSYRANLVSTYQLEKVVRDRLRPEVVKQVDSIVQNPDSLARLQATTDLVRQLSLWDVMETKVKPFIRLQAERIAEKGADNNNLQYLVNLANSLQMQVTIDRHLKPAFFKNLRGYESGSTMAYYQIYQLVSLARVLGEEEAVFVSLRPALRKRMLALHANPDENQLNQIINEASYLGMIDEIDAFLKPAARKLIIQYLEEKEDIAQLQRAANLANRFQLGDLAKDTFQPMVEKYLDDAGPLHQDVNQIYQLFNLARSLGIAAPLEKKMTRLALEELDRMEKGTLDPNSLSPALSLIDQMRLKECLPLLLRVGASRENPYWRARAIHLVGKIGTKKTIADLLPIIQDKTHLGTTRISNISIKSQVGDVALAAAVHLSGQRLLDYDYDYARITRLNYDVISYTCLGFSSEQQRENALQKWQESAPENNP
jgi:hypothetical protein